MMSVQEAVSYIFDHSFNEKTEYQDAQKGIDKPMMNYLTAIFRDQIVLSDKQIQRIKKEFGLIVSAYEDAILTFFDLKKK